MKIYLVGGAIRDELLGIPYDEKDWLVVNSSHKETLSNAKKLYSTLSFVIYKIIFYNYIKYR